MTATLYAPTASNAWRDALSHKVWDEVEVIIDRGQEERIRALAAGTVKPEPGHGALLGHQWEPRVIARHVYEAGWQDAVEMTIALAVFLAESQGYDHAIHVNLDGSEDRGVPQLNSVHKWITDEIAYDLEKSIQAAFKLYVAANGFQDWAAFDSGVYLHDSYLGRASRGAANFLAETLLGYPVPDHADGSPYAHALTSPVLDFEHRVAGQLHHVELASAALGRSAASKAKVDATQVELGRARIAAKAPLPVSP